MSKLSTVLHVSIMFALGAAALAALSLLNAQSQVETRTIDGVPHVLNPVNPLNGRVTLEAECVRTINPYELPDVGLKMIMFSRDEAGNVILFDPGKAEGHRFGPDGKYLGPLTKVGQGPGEFAPTQGYLPLFQGPDIWVYGGRKVARFDRAGKLLEERTLKHGFDGQVEAGKFFSTDSQSIDEKTQVWTLRFVEFDMDGTENAVDLLQAENIGMIRDPARRSAFGDKWGTPRFFFSADAPAKRLYCGLNTKYQISVKDYTGRTLFVIEKSHENVKVSRAEVKKIVAWALKYDRSKWMLSAYPDRLIALMGVKPLPKGYLGVIRVAGFEKLELDIFNPDGRYLYAVVPPPDVDLARTEFFASGFGTVGEVGDYLVYREYRVQKLPEVFGK